MNFSRDLRGEGGGERIVEAMISSGLEKCDSTPQCVYCADARAIVLSGGGAARAYCLRAFAVLITGEVRRHEKWAVL